MDACSVCGHELRPAANFCDECGAAVAPSRPAGELKQITVLFGDVVGSMKLAATLDPERLQAIMNDLFNRSAVVVQRYGGTVDKFTGDGLMALFGAPIALEDHATRACICALEIQRVTSDLAADVRRRDGIELHLRIGLNSGVVVAGQIGGGPGSYTAIGHPVGIAQRMESAAPPDGVLCSVSTAGLVEGIAQLSPVDYVAVKGETDKLPARVLQSISTDRPVVGRDEGPLLGRATEVAKLMAAFGTEKGRLIEIVGSPGLGKSRLISEFSKLATQLGAEVMIARCDAHTGDVPLWALSRMLRAMFGIARLDDTAARAQLLSRLPESVAGDSDDVQILYELLGIAVQSGVIDVTLDARRRRLVETMIRATEFRQQRTLLILEDLHWIDAASDATLAEFADTISATQSILVVSYRPEYHGALRERSDTIIKLAPLSGAVTVDIAGSLIGPDPSLVGMAERVAESADGNPFFVEEIVRDLVGRGMLTGSRGDYRRLGETDEITVPATIQAVLASRIDRLHPNAKAILNAAAVIGSRFDLAVLQALRPDTEQADLAELVSVELIDQIEFLPRTRYAFRHPLVRTVAYESQLSHDRADTHRRLAAAIQGLNPTDVDESAALIGTHLEAAGDLDNAYSWHMRAAEWLKSRDIIAARSAWSRARDIADRLPLQDESSVTLRTVPRAMLAWTEWMFGCDPDADANFEQLRALATRPADRNSLMVGIAGRMTALCTNYGQPMAAMGMAVDLADMIDHAATDTITKVDLLFTVLWAQFMAGDYPGTLRTAEQLREIAGTEVNSSVARANAVSGICGMVSGDHEQGRRDLQRGLEQARGLDPTTYAVVMSLQCGLVAVGIDSPADWLLDAARDAAIRADAFGDNFGIICSQWAYGLLLLRMDREQADVALECLERAHAVINKHQTSKISQAPIEADIAIEAARAGDLDSAIARVRDVLGRQFADFNLTFVGLSVTTMIQLLAARRTPADIEEAWGIVNSLKAVLEMQPLAALENCVLFSEAVLADAAGDDGAYRAAVAARREVCRRIEATGDFLMLRPLPSV